MSCQWLAQITSLRAKLDEKERTKSEEVNSYRDKAARSEELIAQLRQDLAKSDNLANELSQLHGGQTEEHARCLEAMKERYVIVSNKTKPKTNALNALIHSFACCSPVRYFSVFYFA